MQPIEIHGRSEKAAESARLARAMLTAHLADDELRSLAVTDVVHTLIAGDAELLCCYVVAAATLARDLAFAFARTAVGDAELDATTLADAARAAVRFLHEHAATNDLPAF